MTDLSTQSPVEIDTQLAALYYAEQEAVLDVKRAMATIHHRAGDKKVYFASTSQWAKTNEEAIAKVKDNLTLVHQPWEIRASQLALDALEAAKAKVVQIRAQAEAFNAEFERRGGWTRAFLAVTSKGHIHASMGCSTCYPTTQYFWFTDLSGHDEAEIVAKAGSDACTVCYPSAPVNDLKRPRSIFSDEEKAAQKSRVEREQAKADRLAKKIAKGLTPDGSEFKVTYVEHHAGGHERDPQTGQSTYVYKDRPRKEFFKTEGAAVQWVVQYAAWEKGLHDGDKAPAFAQVIEAVAAKHGKSVEEVTAEVEAKIAAKIKRDSR
jgi:hypothetical protein